jgi:hypothetical protein
VSDTLHKFLHILKERSKGGNTVKNDIYGEPEIIKHNNIIAKVYSPILTDKERDRRMDAIKQAALRLVLSKETRKDSNK